MRADALAEAVSVAGRAYSTRCRNAWRQDAHPVPGGAQRRASVVLATGCRDLAIGGMGAMSRGVHPFG
ncbi:hypothetical protein BAY61_20025 [Prauserella marina]|nr:hypothetical protein BAY61_20025 [Prauserella marina]